MDAFFGELSKIDEPQASIIHMNELPVGEKFEVTLVNVTNNDLCGRGVRFVLIKRRAQICIFT